MINVKYILVPNGIMKVPDLQNNVNYIMYQKIIVGKKTNACYSHRSEPFLILFFKRVTYINNYAPI